MKIQLRPMEEDDVSWAAGLLCRTIQANSAYISHGELQMGIALSQTELSPAAESLTAQELLEQLRSGAAAMLTATIDDRRAGFVSARIEAQLETSYGVIADIAVEPDLRNRGLGSQLLQRVMEIFRSGNVRRVFLESGLENHGAHHLFAKFGFRPISKVFASEITTGVAVF